MFSNSHSSKQKIWCWCWAVSSTFEFGFAENAIHFPRHSSVTLTTRFQTIVIDNLLLCLRTILEFGDIGKFVLQCMNTSSASPSEWEKAFVNFKYEQQYETPMYFQLISQMASSQRYSFDFVRISSHARIVQTIIAFKILQNRFVMNRPLNHHQIVWMLSDGRESENIGICNKNEQQVEKTNLRSEIFSPFLLPHPNNVMRFPTNKHFDYVDTNTRIAQACVICLWCAICDGHIDLRWFSNWRPAYGN